MKKHAKGNPGRGGKQPGAGQPRADINKAELEKLCSLQCTQDEIAAYFKVSRRTIENYAANTDYAHIFKAGRDLGRISVRRKQFQLLEAGNVTMAIWLGKQLLGQKDKQEFSGPDGGPIETRNVDARERVLSRIAQMAEPGAASQRPGGTD